MIQIDRYTITARVIPAAIIGMPIGLATYTWVPFSLGFAKGATAMFILAALAYALSHATRAAGRCLEDRLWPAWGGAPSVTFLRHRDHSIDPVSKATCHAALVRMGAVPSMPSAADEAGTPETADHTYEAASTWLRNKTRDRKTFALVFEENVNYGFMRNLLACKPYGLVACAIGVLSAAAAFWLGRQPTIELVVTLLIAVYLLGFVNEAALRRQAGTYARRLLEATEILATKPATQSTGIAKPASPRRSIKKSGAAAK